MRSKKDAKPTTSESKIDIESKKVKKGPKEIPVHPPSVDSARPLPNITERFPSANIVDRLDQSPSEILVAIKSNMAANPKAKATAMTSSAVSKLIKDSSPIEIDLTLTKQTRAFDFQQYYDANIALFRTATMQEITAIYALGYKIRTELKGAMSPGSSLAACSVKIGGTDVTIVKFKQNFDGDTTGLDVHTHQRVMAMISLVAISENHDDVINPLALASGIQKRDRKYYLLYTIGMEYTFCRFPFEVSALVCYKTQLWENLGLQSEDSAGADKYVRQQVDGIVVRSITDFETIYGSSVKNTEKISSERFYLAMKNQILSRTEKLIDDALVENSLDARKNKFFREMVRSLKPRPKDELEAKGFSTKPKTRSTK